MTIKRLRPLPSPADLAAMYPTPHDHRIWGQGHHDRVEATIELATTVIPAGRRWPVTDLSCGNGEIARRIYAGPVNPDGTLAALVLGDLAPGHPICGPIEDTLPALQYAGGVFVCSETIEHLDNPSSVLFDAARAFDFLVLSTPLECWDDTNAEHLWAWDQAGVEELADAAGRWRPAAFRRLPTEAYTYGIWVFA